MVHHYPISHPQAGGHNSGKTRAASVRLRDITVNDEQMVLEWRNRPEVARYMYTDHRITPEEHRCWFQRVLKDQTCRYWIVVCDNEDVGLAGITEIDRQNRRCYWAFYLAAPSVRGKGIGSYVEYSILSYVFDELKLNKLCCEVLASNEAVANMHRSFGFSVEGTFREHIWKSGRPHDIVCLAMLRSQWITLKPGIERRLKDRGLL